MKTSNERWKWRVMAAVCAVALGGSPGAKAEEAIAADQFERLHGMVVTQPGESLFWGLPWMIQLDAALERGAAEGKPVFVWCGAGGAPVGVC